MSKVSVKRHLKEIQWRLMLVALFFVAGATLAYQFQQYFIPLLLDPLHGEKLVYLNPAGGFSFIFLISIYAGIAVSFPLLVQQIYAFLRPALPKSVQKKSVFILLSSFFLMVSGIAFGYFIAVPNALGFLYGFADAYVNASLTAESYLNFIVGYTIGIGIVFQIPLLLMLRHTISPLKPGGLMKSEQWVVLGAFIVAAIITPTPDPVNQTIMALPIIAVYQIGVVAVLISIARTRLAAKKANKRAPLSNEQFQSLIAQSQAEDESAVLTPLTPIIQEAAKLSHEVSPSDTLALEHALEDQLETELEAALKIETTPELELATETITTPEPAVVSQPVATPVAPQTVNRPVFRSMDGIIRQPVIRPQA